MAKVSAMIVATNLLDAEGHAEMLFITKIAQDQTVGDAIGQAPCSAVSWCNRSRLAVAVAAAHSHAEMLLLSRDGYKALLQRVRGQVR